MRGSAVMYVAKENQSSRSTLETMRRTLNMFMCLTFACASQSAPRHRVESVRGQVVAYSTLPFVCMNGNGSWSMIIRIESNRKPSKLIRVPFTLPCDRSPDWISAKPSIQKFRLFRRKDCDFALEESIPIDWGSVRQALPVWRRPPATEQFTLPFGEVIPCYGSRDLPEVPAM